jgi:tetratricopeptide (TPR) repeat protein
MMVLRFLMIVGFCQMICACNYMGNQPGDMLNSTDAASLEQTGRDYYSKGDFKQAIYYLEMSRAEYERQGDMAGAAKNLQNIGLAYLMTADFNQAMICLLQAETLFIALKDKNQLAYCLNNLGLVSYYKGDYPAALDHYKKASQIYQEIDKPDEFTELVNRTGMTYWSMGIHDKALQHLHQYIAELKPGNPKKHAIGYNNLGAIYKEIGNSDKALEFYRMAVEFYLAANDSLDLPSPLTNIGTIFSARNITDSAFYYYQKSLMISDRLNDQLQSAKTKHNIALIYKYRGQFAEAEALLTEYLNISRELGYKEGIGQAELSLGNLARDQRKWEMAIEYYKDCIRDAGNIKLLSILMQAHKNLADVLQDIHRDREALIHFQEYLNVKDTLFNSEKTRIITELETRYETEKKEQENILLLKENELKDKTINILFVTLAGIVILTAAIFFLIILYRRNAMNKKRLAESEAARMAEKVEFQNRELASSALALSRNLNFIKNLLTELKELAPHVDAEGLNTVKSISRNIQHLDNDPAWEEFEIRFHQVHNKFYDTLSRKFPSLTTNEVRLCALLKLGMNTKEISSVTFQNIRAIETARLRLRKKLELDGSADLGSFLQKI